MSKIWRKRFSDEHAKPTIEQPAQSPLTFPVASPVAFPLASPVADPVADPDHPPMVRPSGSEAPGGAGLERHPVPGTGVAVRMLGPFGGEVAGRQIDGWGSSKSRILLQFLLIRRQPAHREVLMELLWPGHTYSSARNNLNVCLYGLRRAVGATPRGHLIVYRDNWYHLNPELAWEIDRDRFVDAVNALHSHDRAGRLGEALAAGTAAVGLYRGPLFDGDPLADWFEAERVSLHTRYLDALERVAELDLAAGDLLGAELALHCLLQGDGCRESAHRLLMRCFAVRGQRDLVVRQYHRCVSALRVELDVTPSVQTVDLFHELVAAT